MSEIAKDQIKAMASAVGLVIEEPDLTDVYNRLNAMLEGLKALDKLDLQGIEPIPVLPAPVK
ncbi:MAG: hypothetical protein HYU29_05675 [Chloroflexi bacterium]|nr:hypothetical protein [Chloroflexota bacterium]